MPKIIPVEKIEDIRNKVTEINNEINDEHYPSAKAVVNEINNLYDYTNNNVTNALRGSTSGNIVTLKDISPLPHDINVKLINGESVTVCSKNLFDKSKSLIDGIKNETTISGKYQTVFNQADLVRNLKPNVKYTLSYEVECLSVPENAKNAVKNEKAVGLALRIKGGSAFVINYQLMNAGEILNVSNTFTLTEEQYNSENLEMLAYCNGYTVDNFNYEFSTEIIRNIQIEEGVNTTDYVPYIEPTTYTADADGKLTVPSVYPSMMIVADEGARITTQYNKDINKAFEELRRAIINLGGNVV